MGTNYVYRFVLALFCAGALAAQPGFIGVAAGNGTTSYNGDNIPATTAAIRPGQIALDAAGNLYIADAGNSRIRRVDAATGIITTVAGGGTGGDDSAATSALLTNPCGIKVDGQGNLLISESCFASGGGGGGFYSFSRIRKVLASTGVISTLAGGNGSSGFSGDGGPASLATLTIPVEITADPAGNIYFADMYNQRVRRIDAASGVITTLTGSGFPSFYGDGGPANFAALNNPIGVAADTAGNVYIADRQNNRIRKVTVATGIITSVAGNGTAGFNGDGIAATSAALNLPEGVAVDSAGNLYIGDTANGRVRKVDAATGLISTVTITSWLNQPASLAWSPSGKLYITERAANRVRLITLSSGTATAVSLAPGSTASLPNQPITLTATVTPATATGSVVFSSANGAFTTVPLVNGVATYSLSWPLGQYVINANYLGDAGFQASTSAPTNLAIQYPTLQLTSNANPSSQGQPVTFTATITPAAPSGTVDFSADYAFIGSASVSAGVATFTTSSLVAGTRYISASFSGSGVGASGSLSQVVNNTTTLALSASTLNTVVAQPVTFTATANPATTTGAVDFLDGAAVIGSATLASGTASFATAALAAGTHSITARYNTVSSPAVSVTIRNATSVALASSANPATAASPVTFTATVSPATATGAVQFFDGATLLGAGSVASGAATFATSTLSAGSHAITAQYAGDSSHAGSTSAALSQVVKVNSSAALAASPAAATTGQPVALTATLTPATATGPVDFLDGATVIGSGTLTAGVATFSTSTLADGAHSLTARFNGDAQVNASTSPAVAVTVRTASTTALAATPNPVTSPNPVTLTATVTPATATGTIQFFDGAALAGTGAITAGVATLSAANLTAGSHSLTAVYSGDAQVAASTSSAATVSVLNAVSLQLQANTTVLAPGQSVTFSAIFSPSSVTGDVQFLDNGAPLGTAAIASGAAQFTTTSLTLGAHAITATFSGNSSYAAASAGMSVSVKTQPTSTLSSNPANSATSGQSVTVTATLNTNATGTVQFLDNGAPLGTPVTLTGGAGSFTTTALANGSHPITATYSGDERYHAVPLSGFNLSVKAASTVTLVSSANPSTVGQTFTLTATVTPATATGNVVFVLNNGGSSAPITNGVATIQIGYLQAGMFSYTAVYTGDSSLAEGTSAPLNQVVKAATTTAVASSANPSVAGQSVTFTTQVTPATATGAVQFLDNGTVIATATLASGAASFTTAALGVGAHSITVAYAGDATNAASTSGALAQTVNKLATTTAVASSANPSVAGQSVTFTTQVTPATATGTVQFLDNGAVIATAALASGSASFTTSALSVGAHLITVVYSGSATHLASTSAALGQNLNKANSAAAVTTSVNPSATGQGVTFTVTVTPATATGTVQLKDGAATLATLTLTAGAATYTTSALSAGSHTMQAVYAGNATFNGSTSAAFTQTVRTATTLTLTSNRNPARTTQNVTFTANVSPSAATGTVQFFDGATLLGTATISGSKATLTRTGMTVATHPIQAVYSGSANHAPSTSAVLNQSITN